VKLLIIDGKSGRMGAQIIEGLRKAGISEEHTIIAVGTNALATSAMINAGADRGATGENAVVVQCKSADVIVGTLGIALADSMLGEVSPNMAVAVGQSTAERILLPTDKCNTFIVGAERLSMRQLVETAVEKILQIVS